jgi:hypothetical protein
MILALLSLLTLIVMWLIVMWVTLRSPMLGIAGSLTVAVAASLSGVATADWLTLVAGGLLLGLLTGARWRPSLVLIGAGVPLGLQLAIVYLRQGAAALRAEWTAALDAAGITMEYPAGTVEPMIDVVIKLLPALTIIVVVGNLTICYAIAVRLMPRLGQVVRPLAPIATWRLPFAVIWSLVAALALVALGWSMERELLRVIGGNLCVLHGAAFFMLGLAVVRHVLEMRRVPGRLQLVMGVLSIPLAFLWFIVFSGLGLFDMWFDFRKLDQGVAS